MNPDVEPLLARLKRAARRLEAHAAYPAYAGLTDPDPEGTERWEAGQVWAHIAEFPAYWLEQARGVIAAGPGSPVPFGRTKTDPGRLAAIERERRTAPIDLFERARSGIEDVSEVLRELPPAAWERVGEHPTLGPMSIEQIMERFVVAHLEEHADQLDLLAGRAAAEPPTAGLAVKRSWPVWSNRTEHRVDVELKLLTGSLRVDVDGQEAVKRSGWKMGLNRTEVPFEVDGRPCLLVVRQRYGDTAPPDIDLYSEGRSLTDGSPLEARLEAQGREIPNLVRMLILFMPLIGLPSFLRSLSSTAGGAATWVWIIVIGAALAIAGAGWWLAGRWYGRGTDAPHRHLGGGAIVAACWVLFFAIFAIALAIGR